MTDRDAKARDAHRHLREGHVERAVDEYERLVDRHPGDWNLVNALGDAYLSAGDRQRAAAQFIKAADALSSPTEMSKAAALYKKALRVRPDDDHALSRLGELAAEQGRSVDARRYLRKLADLRRARGDEPGAAECLDRLAALEGPDPAAKVLSAQAARSTGDRSMAAALFRSAARAYEAEGRTADAFDTWSEVCDADPDHGGGAAGVARTAAETRHFDRARRVLAGDQPDVLLARARVELAARDQEQVRRVAARLMATAPERHVHLVRLACEAAGRDVEIAFAAVEVVADSLVAADDDAGAIRALEAFAGETPHIPALMRLVELAIESGKDDLMRHSQARLCDAYLEAGRPEEARVLAEDLVAARSGDEQQAQRLRRVMNALALTSAPNPAERSVDADPTPATTSTRDQEADETVALEVDLTERLAVGEGAPRAAPASTEMLDQVSEPLEEVFERLRDRASRDHPEAAERYRRGLRLLGEGRLAEAIDDLEQAARAPLLRFRAAARLGRLHLASGDLEAGVTWLDLAAESAAPEPEEGRSVLYDLADTLERLGDGPRALAIMIEIEAESGGYRDVRERIERLTRAGAGSPEA